MASIVPSNVGVEKPAARDWFLKPLIVASCVFGALMAAVAYTYVPNDRPDAPLFQVGRIPLWHAAVIAVYVPTLVVPLLFLLRRWDARLLQARHVRTTHVLASGLFVALSYLYVIGVAYGLTLLDVPLAGFCKGFFQPRWIHVPIALGLGAVLTGCSGDARRLWRAWVSVRGARRSNDTCNTDAACALNSGP